MKNEPFKVYEPILVVGTGEMASEYVKLLKYIGIDKRNILVLGRSKKNADIFTNKYEIPCFYGGTDAIKTCPVSNTAIVAVSHLQLYEVTLALIQRGYRNILIEKPGAVYLNQLQQIECFAKKNEVHVYIAFNRRFYSSIVMARNIIKQDGGLLSCSFDFTELEASVLKASERKKFSKEELKRWGILNSFHIIDLFLHLAGLPENWNYYQCGTLPWHPNASIFSGSGSTSKNVLFSYLSTWSGAGRWGIELTTQNRKLILQPLELLQSQPKGSFTIEKVPIPDEPIGIKPGLKGQIETFLKMSKDKKSMQWLCPINEAIIHFRIAEKILGYDHCFSSKSKDLDSS